MNWNIVITLYFRVKKQNIKWRGEVNVWKTACKINYLSILSSSCVVLCAHRLVRRNLWNKVSSLRYCSFVKGCLNEHSSGLSGSTVLLQVEMHKSQASYYSLYFHVKLICQLYWWLKFSVQVFVIIAFFDQVTVQIRENVSCMHWRGSG